MQWFAFSKKIVDKKSILLLGYGQVAKKFVEIMGGYFFIDIKGVCVKDKNKSRDIPYQTFYNIDEALSQNYDIIIETVNGMPDVYNLIEKCIGKTNHIVSLNKELWQTRESETLIELTNKSRTTLWLDGIVCDDQELRYTQERLTNHNFLQLKQPDFFVFRNCGPKEAAESVVDIVNYIIYHA